MKAIEILTKLSEEIKLAYQQVEDFCGWAVSNSNIEVEHESAVYCIDFSIKGFRSVVSELSVFKPQMISGKKKWFKTAVDKATIEFLENSVSNLIILRFDELVEAEMEEAKEIDRRIEDEILMQETYRTLNISER